MVVPENLAANADLLKPRLARSISYVLTFPDQRLALCLTNSRNARRPSTVAEFKVVRDGLDKSGTGSQVNNLTEGVRAALTRPHSTQP